MILCDWLQFLFEVLLKNQEAEVSITFRNTGKFIWNSSEDYKLAILDDQCGLIGLSRVNVPPDVIVPPDGTFTFRFMLKAPSKARQCAIKFQMIQERVVFFQDPYH